MNGKLSKDQIMALLPPSSSAAMAEAVHNILFDQNAGQTELQKWLELEGLAGEGNTSISDKIFAAMKSPPAVQSGTAGTSTHPPAAPVVGPRSPVGYLAAAIVGLVVIAAVLYAVDSKRVDGRIDATAARMPTVAHDIAKAELKSAFGEKFLAAAPTWAKPAKPKCTVTMPQTSNDCLGEQALSGAMQCCDVWAGTYGKLSAECRFVVRQNLSKSAPYPPPPVSSNP